MPSYSTERREAVVAKLYNPDEERYPSIGATYDPVREMVKQTRTWPSKRRPLKFSLFSNKSGLCGWFSENSCGCHRIPYLKSLGGEVIPLAMAKLYNPDEERYPSIGATYTVREMVKQTRQREPVALLATGKFHWQSHPDRLPLGMTEPRFLSATGRILQEGSFVLSKRVQH
jgi:hypothetical protein